MVTFLAKLHPRKQAALLGMGGGLAVLLAQAWLPFKTGGYSRFREAFRNGVGLGLGIGGGTVGAMNAIMLLADRAAPEDVAPDPRAAPAAAETPANSNPPAASDSEASAEPVLTKGEGWSAVAAGGLATALVGVAIATALTLTPSVSSLGRRRGWLSGIEYGNREHIDSFKRQVGLGASLGAGLLLAGAALNWMVEELDSIVGEQDRPAANGRRGTDQGDGA